MVMQATGDHFQTWDSMRNGHSNAGLRTVLDAGQVDFLNQRSSFLFKRIPAGLIYSILFYLTLFSGHFSASHLLSLFPNPHLAGPLTLSHSVAESTPRSCPLEAVFTHPPQQRGTEERPEAQRQAAGAGGRRTQEITGEEETRQEMKIRDA